MVGNSILIYRAKKNATWNCSLFVTYSTANVPLEVEPNEFQVNNLSVITFHFTSEIPVPVYMLEIFHKDTREYN